MFFTYLNLGIRNQIRILISKTRYLTCNLLSVTNNLFYLHIFDIEDRRMFLSQYFLPTLKDTPAEASIISHQLMLRAGMIRPLASGIYSWLPLGLKVLKRIEAIVRQEMDDAHGQEVIMPCIQPASLWKQSGRFGDGSDLSTETLVMKDRHDCELLFSPTAEEVICDIFKNNVQSYRDLPKNLYQIQWKFRDEIRPRYGVMRGREFLMKDAYSFDMDEESSIQSYENMLIAYLNAFNRMGLQPIPVRANTGSIGGDYSHEIHVLAETGESVIYYERGLLEALEDEAFDMDDLENFYAMEEEKHNATEQLIPAEELCVSKGIEVGHLFYLGTKYSSAMSVKVQNKNGELIHPHMGCYGIGISRLVGAIIEANHDDSGIIWPIEVAPFHCIILNLNVGNEDCDAVAVSIYSELSDIGLDILYDDTADTVGAKFARADLIGIPFQIVVGTKNVGKGLVEIKFREDGEMRALSKEDAMNSILEVLLVKE